jgi:HK97 family phage prohead protease
MNIIRKTTEGAPEGFDFCCSSERTDRYGDVIVVSGIDLQNFYRNNVALFNHNSNAPIGTWENMRVESNELRGRLKLAPEGASPRIDEIRALVKAKVLKSTSIGFLPVESEPVVNSSGNRTGGTKFLRSELVEVSLVAVPANSDAVALAKSLRISAPTMKMVFKQPGQLSLGDRIRQLRRTIEKTKLREASASTAQLRETYARSIVNLEKYERELALQFSANSTSAARKIERERVLKDFQAQVRAVQAEVERVTDEFYARVAAGAWGVDARAADDVSAFTKTHEQMDQRQRLGEAAKQASDTRHDWGDTSSTSWRGQKVPKTPAQTWRGKKYE